MPSVLTRILLFLSSYLPLCLIFSVLWWGTYTAAAIVVGLVGLVSAGWLISYLGAANDMSATPVEFETVRRNDGEAMSYVVSYLIPFLAVAAPDLQQGLALAIFFAMLGALYVNSNLIHINPMLNLAGYHLFEVTLADGSSRTLISDQKDVRASGRYRVIQAGTDILLAKRSAS